MAKMNKKTKTVRKPTIPSAGKGRLELVPRNLADMPLLLMRHLYFRPQAFRKTLTKSEEKRYGGSKQEALNYLKNSVWPAEEIVVNRSLEALLLAAPPTAVARAFNEVAPTGGLLSPQLCKIRVPKKIRSDVGAPDFVLWDEKKSAVLLGEIKIGAKPGNGRYSYEQLVKYMRLGLLARGSLGIKNVTHLIVLPTLQIEEHCEDSDYWRPAIEDGRLVERANRFMTTMVEYGMIAGDCARHLDSFDAELVQKCLDPKNPLIPIDTFVTSWRALCERLTDACVAQHAGHLKDSLRVLQRLGEGRFAAESTGGPD